MIFTAKELEEIRQRAENAPPDLKADILRLLEARDKTMWALQFSIGDLISLLPRFDEYRG